jgi:hypothetical protein
MPTGLGAAAEAAAWPLPAGLAAPGRAGRVQPCPERPLAAALGAALASQGTAACLYAVVDTSDWSVVEWTSTRTEAERFIDEVRGDDEDLAAELDVAVVEIAVSMN